MLQNDQRVLVGIRRLDKSRYTVTTYDLGDNADDGATEIQKFVEVFTAGTLDPRSLYAQRSNEELAAIPELGNLMRLRCISL